MPCRALRGRKNRRQFIRFFKQSLGFRQRNDSRFRHQFQPQNYFVCLLHNYSDFGHKFGLRPGPANSPIVRRDRGATSQELLPQHLRIRLIEQRSVEPNHPQSECLCSIPQLLRLTAHSHHPQIAQSPNFIYRSISPSTISMLPIAATTSASRRPSHMVGSVCRLAKQALRMCTL